METQKTKSSSSYISHSSSGIWWLVFGFCVTFSLFSRLFCICFSRFFCRWFSRFFGSCYRIDTGLGRITLLNQYYFTCAFSYFTALRWNDDTGFHSVPKQKIQINNGCSKDMYQTMVLTLIWKNVTADISGAIDVINFRNQLWLEKMLHTHNKTSQMSRIRISNNQDMELSIGYPLDVFPSNSNRLDLRWALLKELFSWDSLSQFWAVHWPLLPSTASDTVLLTKHPPPNWAFTTFVMAIR